MIKGVVFDLDGTLIDSMKVWYETDRKFMRENGVYEVPAEVSENLKKMTIFESSGYLIDYFHFDFSKEYLINRIEELVRIEYEQNIGLKPYVREILDFLDSECVPCGIATATYKSLAEAVLKRCGISKRFDFIFTDEDYPNGKKFPDIFLGCAEKFGIKPSETLVVEDSLHSIITAKNAGFVTVGIYDESSKSLQKDIENTADYYFSSLEGLKNLF